MIPVSHSLPPMNEVRRIAVQELPGHSIRCGLFYRYLLSWTKTV